MFDRFVLKLKVGGLRNPGIYGNLLLYDFMTHRDQEVELVQGSLALGRETCWHLWVETAEGQVLDVIRASVEGDAEFVYSKECDEKAERDEEITQQYELYKEDRKEFWKKAPVKVKNFRAKMFRQGFM